MLNFNLIKLIFKLSLDLLIFPTSLIPVLPLMELALNFANEASLMPSHPLQNVHRKRSETPAEAFLW